LQFIEEKKNAPFFLVHSLYAVHNPLQAPTQLINKYKAKKELLNIKDEKRFAPAEPWMQFEKNWKTRIVQDNAVYAAMIENMDWNIGRMIDKLKALGLLENTIIIFTSDNGGLSTAEGSPTANTPLRAGKGWLYEGGIRVPFIMYWNGKIHAGTVSDLPVNTVDIFPTVAKAINKTYQKENTIDGTAINEMLTKQVKSSNREIIWHYPHYSNQGGKPGAAIRIGNYKLIYFFEDKSTELFNLSTDISEQLNIAAQNQPLVESMKKKLLGWLQKNKGIRFRINPAYKE
jgi:arylsulfatase A-like enzyme